MTEGDRLMSRWAARMVILPQRCCARSVVHGRSFTEEQQKVAG